MQELYKGYVTTKNKKCTMKFKNARPDELLSYDEVKSMPEYAGIINDDVVLIDIDDYDESEVMMKIVEDLQLDCRVYKTTRGKHFFFMNAGRLIEHCGTHKNLACGIMADIKVGFKNSYSVLKYKGKEREIIYDVDESEEYQELPKWLTPINVKTSFNELEQGDGRNQALFNYILTLQSNDFSVDEAKECLQIINKYILKDPLSDQELETLSRDEAFQKPIFFRRNQFLFDKFARYIKNNNHIIKIDGLLHVYKDGVYVNGIKEIEAQMIQHIPDLNRSKRAEVLSYLDIMIMDNTQMSPANYIAFNNGIYDLETDELLDFTPEIVTTNKIPYDYVKDAYSEFTDKALNKLACNDEDIRALLEECIGYCFYRRNELRKSFILTGEKENGKSTFLSMLDNLLGKENTAGLDLKELGDRFKTAELFGKLANIGDDIGDEFIPNPSVFKKLSAGNPVNVERKGLDPFDFSNYAKLIFSANDIPKIRDKSGAVLSRLVIIPFNARFSAEDPDFDPYIKYKLIKREPMEYMIQIGLEGLKRLLKNQKFTTSGKVEKAIDDYERGNNPILSYLDEDPKIENESTKAVYQQYFEYCIANNFKPLSNIEFSRQIKKYCGYDIVNKSVKGKKYRVFVEREV